MLFTKSTITVALSLLSLTTALPTTQSSVLTTRDDTQCKAGTTFHVCTKNGFRGCCSDPLVCDLDAGCPDENSSPPPKSPTCKDGKARVYQPKMQTIQAGAEPVSTPNLDLYKSLTKERSQTMTFTVPADAKSCSLGWGVPAKRNFTVGKMGGVKIWEGTDTAKDTVGGADFTFWDEDPKARDHSAIGSIDCKEKMEFTTKLTATREQLEKMDEKEKKETHVSIDQNEETGWFVEYDC